MSGKTRTALIEALDDHCAALKSEVIDHPNDHSDDYVRAALKLKHRLEELRVDLTIGEKR